VTIPPPAEIRRIAYLGTPALAVPPLLALVEAGYDVALVVSGDDKRRGRGGRSSAAPVKAAAIRLGIPVTTDVAVVVEAGVDLGVVVAFGQLIDSAVLDVVPMVNIHFSLLPRWRGAAPVERAILAGDEQTGVCLMVVDHELDTGAVYRSDVVSIGPDESLEQLRARLVEIGTTQLIDALEEGLGEPTPQTGEPSYAAKITSADLELDWAKPAPELHRVVRLGGAWTTYRGRRLKVHRAVPVGHGPGPGHLDGLVVGAGTGGLELIDVQPEGKPVQAAADWARGARPDAGDVLGS
jgi:methionyl-tRNA formyltransferase